MLLSYKGKKVLVTGHTGFKGAWLSIWLNELGADVIGFSLLKYKNDFVFQKSRLHEHLVDERGDVSDLNKLKEIFNKHKPEIVFHLAAQPLVRLSYDMPAETFSTNVMGTVNVLECIRTTDSVKAGVIITSDKCYKNKEQKQGYKETDELGGHDPYSASKACAEIAVSSYRDSFFIDRKKLVASARAGNVIGGGDFAQDRLVPDCINALNEKKEIIIRNPSAVRPWQHVLEPSHGYLLLGAKLLEGKKEYAEAWNFGPDNDSSVPVNRVADLIVENWGFGSWKSLESRGKNHKKHETNILCLNNSKAKQKLGWIPKWNINEAIKHTVEGYKNLDNDFYGLCLSQINIYQGGKNN